MSYIETEREKYEKVYTIAEYGRKGHGAPLAPVLFARSSPALMADFGCGRGFSIKPYISAGYKVIPVDHCDVLDPQWRQHPNILPFWRANLWADSLPEVDYAICTDVAEHIPRDMVPAMIANIARHVRKGCLWTICHVQEVWGRKVGEILHMTVEPREWWEAELAKQWGTVELIDTKTPHHTTLWTSH